MEPDGALVSPRARKPNELVGTPSDSSGALEQPPTELSPGKRVARRKSKPKASGTKRPPRDVDRKMPLFAASELVGPLMALHASNGARESLDMVAKLILRMLRTPTGLKMRKEHDEIENIFSAVDRSYRRFCIFQSAVFATSQRRNPQNSKTNLVELERLVRSLVAALGSQNFVNLASGLLSRYFQPKSTLQRALSPRSPKPHIGDSVQRSLSSESPTEIRKRSKSEYVPKPKDKPLESAKSDLQVSDSIWNAKLDERSLSRRDASREIGLKIVSPATPDNGNASGPISPRSGTSPSTSQGVSNGPLSPRQRAQSTENCAVSSEASAPSESAYKSLKSRLARIVAGNRSGSEPTVSRKSKKKKNSKYSSPSPPEAFSPTSDDENTLISADTPKFSPRDSSGDSENEDQTLIASPYSDTPLVSPKSSTSSLSNRNEPLEVQGASLDERKTNPFFSSVPKSQVRPPAPSLRRELIRSSSDSLGTGTIDVEYETGQFSLDLLDSAPIESSNTLEDENDTSNAFVFGSAALSLQNHESAFQTLKTGRQRFASLASSTNASSIQYSFADDYVFQPSFLTDGVNESENCDSSGAPEAASSTSSVYSSLITSSNSSNSALGSAVDENLLDEILSAHFSDSDLGGCGSDSGPEDNTLDPIMAAPEEKRRKKKRKTKKTPLYRLIAPSNTSSHCRFVFSNICTEFFAVFDAKTWQTEIWENFAKLDRYINTTIVYGRINTLNKSDSLEVAKGTLTSSSGSQDSLKNVSVSSSNIIRVWSAPSISASCSKDSKEGIQDEFTSNAPKVSPGKMMAVSEWSWAVFWILFRRYCSSLVDSYSHMPDTQSKTSSSSSSSANKQENANFSTPKFDHLVFAQIQSILKYNIIIHQQNEKCHEWRAQYGLEFDTTKVPLAVLQQAASDSFNDKSKEESSGDTKDDKTNGSHVFEKEISAEIINEYFFRTFLYSKPLGESIAQRLALLHRTKYSAELKLQHVSKASGFEWDTSVHYDLVCLGSTFFAEYKSRSCTIL